MSVSEDGHLILPDGMSYRVLVLPEMDRIRPELLRKIKHLVQGGATVVGPKPVMSPSLQHGADRADLEVKMLANEIWGDIDGIQRNRHYFGKGMVTWGIPLKEVLSMKGLFRDAEFDHPLDSSIVWTHRRKEDTDIYFVANQTDNQLEFESRVRVTGREAELWHPDTGEIEPASYSFEQGRTRVPLHLEPRESIFVVFRRPAATRSRRLPTVAITTLANIVGPWEVVFPPNLGAPGKIQLDRLDSWTKNPDKGVQYFSGTATYRKTMRIHKDWLEPEARIILDLGKVKDIAGISINEKPAVTLWKPPYQYDISNLLRAGANLLEISVTNQWTNRRIGDRKLDEDSRILASEPAWMTRFGPPEILAEAGLIGPVTLISVKNDK
jgi:hypothetical protein